MKCPICGKWMPNSWLVDHLCEYEGWTLAEVEEWFDDNSV